MVISGKFVDWSKAQIVNISAERLKREKNESTLLSGTFKVSENKVVLFFHFLPLGRVIDYLFFDQSTKLTETTSDENLGSLLRFMSFFRGHNILKEKLC